MKRTASRVWITTAATVVAALLLVVLSSLLGAPALSADSAPNLMSPGPDVIVESITINPLIPDPGQMFTLSIVTRNQGDVTTGISFWNHVYLDPVDDPPTESTTHTLRYASLPIGPGGSGSYTRGQDEDLSFSTAGCDHVIYVWADKPNDVSEDIETNNVLSQTVCVGVTCQADAYEADDDCGSAQWITNTAGIPQSRTFCPVGDKDWARFVAIGGMTYVVEATNLGPHADPSLSLYGACAGQLITETVTTPRIEWVAPSSGVYWVHVEHRQVDYGPLASYDLSISTAGGSGDVYEPDDTCNVARDIPTDGTRQTHRFDAASDRDWVRFTVDSGNAFAIIVDNTGLGVNPLIYLYSSCGQAFASQVAESDSGEIATSTATGHTYYAKVINQDPDVYGPDAFYDIRVTASACVADGFEEDDSITSAMPVPTTGVTQTRNTCPAGDADWITFTAQVDTVYVLETSNLGAAADTFLHLYDTDGQTELAQSDDYGYGVASRIVWQAPANGVYYAKVHHHNASASGPDTEYDLSIATGRCIPDDYEGDNASFAAPSLVPDGEPQERNFCADPVLSDVSDQDWARFEAVGGSPYLVQTSDLGPNSDTMLNLYDRDGVTLLASNDDHSSGGASAISLTVPEGGTYYVQVLHFNSSYFGRGTNYQLSVLGEIPPAPTPTPTPSPTPTPPPTPTPSPNQVETLILVNRERFASIHGATAADSLMSKLYDLADHTNVKGVVVQVEEDASVAAAYGEWTANQSALLDAEKTNAVASAVRNLVMTFLIGHPSVEHIIIVGDDRIIPHRRVPEGDLSKAENTYATSITTDTTQWAACQDNMILTDDYYADETPTDWGDGLLYLPDYAIGRLIEQPSEIMAFIDVFLVDDVIETNNMLVTAYDFVRDSGNVISTLFKNDSLTTNDDLIGFSWLGASLRDKQLNASPRFDVQSINGHSDHTSEKTPDGDDIMASEIASASADLSGALIFSVGCHSGLNEAGTLDLAQAFAQKKANYVGNTGFGWGGGGIVYSEALMRNYARELLRDTSTQIGPALTAAKQRYYDHTGSIGPYDVKILMQSILYGLPMVQINTGGTLGPDDPFPSTVITTTPPSAFGDVSVGRLAYGMAGAFGETVTETGTVLDIDGSVHFSAGEPVQPRFFADVAAPAAGALHGAVFLGGAYTEVHAFDPVIALPYNEYITSTDEPAFNTPGWYPAVPFQVRASDSVSTSAETIVTVLGQFSSDDGVERAFDQMDFDTYYSENPDSEEPEIKHVDGVLDEGAGTGRIKVEASDVSDIIRVLVAYTDGQGLWLSRDLAYDSVMARWTGVISSTGETRYLVQVVDGAGNVALDDNKGLYHPLSLPLPLIESSTNQLYLPLIMRGG